MPDPASAMREKSIPVQFVIFICIFIVIGFRDSRLDEQRGMREGLPVLAPGIS